MSSFVSSVCFYITDIYGQELAQLPGSHNHVKYWYSKIHEMYDLKTSVSVILVVLYMSKSTHETGRTRYLHLARKPVLSLLSATQVKKYWG